MSSGLHVALIRGINVGGRNRLPMADLRAVLGQLGFTDVQTYIQSGNAVYRGAGDPADHESAIGAALGEALGTDIPVVVRSRDRFREVVDGAPEVFETEADTHHRDVIFLRDELAPADAMSVVRCREGVDDAWAGPGVIYFRRLSAERTRSRMSSIVGTPQYRSMTIRNWATTTRLLEMLDDA